MSTPILLLDIEERLYADNTGEVRKNLIERLLGMQASLQAKMRSLNDKTTHNEVQSALRAVDNALLVMTTISIIKERSTTSRPK